MGSTKLIVGLGNPGIQYSRNRHNIGFQVVDLLGRRSAIALDKMQHKAMTGTGWLEKGSQRSKVILARPLTFMNNSGDAVAPLARFFQIEPADILVVADDLDLASGKLRMRKEGSSGGQNGIKSIIEKLGSPHVVRLKIGIGRPPGRMDPADYVLQNFSAEEEMIFGPLRERACEAIEWWVFEGVEAAMNRFNG